ncbi:hypothetical protein KZ483_15785 [Paenibacillus sp. sptzw28]|uniref:hypothetical protein n=1 Tax=Paenibacillus sp. sptzw28 TaxID=715179 RepID=UPI001C6EACD6|nr:hypothetical protein [Paenibacillus sp. sptzw28]QYR19389.1 hypothetical protein KZ483_15785 [Paenibacillus sp. sptzw28]
MTHQLTVTKSGHNINLAFMECFTSCVLTYLNINGKDYRRVLLDYWNLSYQYKTLLSGKDARQLPLEFLYGIKLKFFKGDVESLRRCVQDGSSAICLGAASKLRYFPREYLGMESSGFQHSILIYGWNEEHLEYLVTDPMVDAVVNISPKEIVHACEVRAGRQELHYFILEESNSPFEEPDLESCLAYCSYRNLSFYKNRGGSKTEPLASVPDQSQEQRKSAWREWFSNRHGGYRSLEIFEEDLVKSQEWAPPRRADWVSRNTMTISSIKRIRAMVWNAYRESASLEESQYHEGQRQIDSILAMWNAVSLHLLKYKSGQIVIPAISKQLEKLKHAELQFLEWLHLAAGKGEYHGPEHG